MRLGEAYGECFFSGIVGLERLAEAVEDGFVLVLVFLGKDYERGGSESVFDFQRGRDRAGPKKFLEQWQGILQTDGYAAYDRVGGPTLIHVGCWAHARRKFVDAVKVNPQDAEAIKMITRMDALFLVDRHAREQQLDSEKRLAFRREHALLWVEDIHEECRALAKSTLPKSALGQAVAYTLKTWSKLRRCFDYGEVELSNNLAENSGVRLRSVARTGCMWEVRRQAPKSRRFCRWWNRAGGFVFRSRTTCLMYFRE